MAQLKSTIVQGALTVTSNVVANKLIKVGGTSDQILMADGSTSNKSDLTALINAAVTIKGTLGTGGTITSLPTASASNLGHGYKVITAGTYNSVAAKIGDMFICYKNGSSYAWMHIPSGDDIEDTWRPVQVNGTQILANGNTTGAINLKAGSNVSISNSSGTVTFTATDTGATSIETTGSGNAVTSASYDSATRKITLTKGTTFLTEHQSLADYVKGPSRSTDNAIARFNSTTGKLIRNSTVTIDDSGNTVLPANATLKLNAYGTRFITLSGNNISADMSNETGGWAGAFASVKDPSGTTTTMLGWYGSTSLNHIYMGGAYNDPYMKMTASGLFTFKNQVTINAAQGTAPLAVTSTTVNTNLNADLLDGKHASAFALTTDIPDVSDFVTKSTNQTITGIKTFSHSTFGAIVLKRNGSTNASSIIFQNNNGTLGSIGMTSTANGGLKRWSADTASSYTIWDSGNDGSGSGLDADKLDGQEGSYYLNYNNFTNKPTIPAAQIQSDWNQTDTSKLDYIKNKPTIPTVNNATLTIQKNGTTVKTFTANASTDVTANITVPTKTSELTNDSGFWTGTKYWANVAVSGSSSTATTPSVQKLGITGSTTATATAAVTMEYDSSYKALKFVFA